MTKRVINCSFDKTGFITDKSLLKFMKVGIVTEYFYPTLGGIAENIYHLSKELLRQGHDFRIITGRHSDPGDIDPEIKVRMIYIGRSIPVFFNKSSGRLTVGMNLTRDMKEVLQREKFDILHIHSPLFPTLTMVANVQSEVPIVGTFHTCTGGDLFYYKIFHTRISKFLSRMSARIAVSESCAAENRLHFDEDFEVIHNGVDVNWWANGGKKISRFDDGKINILFLGRPDLRNGLDAIIGAFIRVNRKNKNTRLIVVGDGPLKFHFEKMVPDELKNSVFFEGSALMTRPDYTASSHIFCFAPTIASFGITILEGMAAGKAIIASDIEAFRSLIKDGESALLIPPRSETAIAEAMFKLAENENLRLKLGAKAYENVLPYDWKNIGKQYIDRFTEIISS